MLFYTIEPAIYLHAYTIIIIKQRQPNRLFHLSFFFILICIGNCIRVAENIGYSGYCESSYDACIFAHNFLCRIIYNLLHDLWFNFSCLILLLALLIFLLSRCHSHIAALAEDRSCAYRCRRRRRHQWPSSALCIPTMFGFTAMDC